jgi:hypothetical protein
MKNTMIGIATLAMATILLPDLPLPPDTECVSHRVWVKPTPQRTGYWANINICTILNKAAPDTSKIKEES